jgi:diguanylate cyclase (GGDEF)-like protein/PAS domain S-box-containing protein
VAGDVGELSKLLFRHSPVPQFVSGADGAVVIANPAYAALVGGTPQSVVGTVPADVTHPDDLREILRRGGLLLDREIDVFEVEARVYGRDKQERWCVITCTLAVGDDGQPLFVSHLLDITERKEAEAQLAISQARFRLLADSLPVGVHQRDRQGLLVYVNQRWAQITGISVADAIGRDHIEMVHPDDRDQLMRASLRLARDGGTYHEQFRIVRPGGEVRWVSSRAVWLPGGDGQPLAYVGSLEDITGLLEAEVEQKRLEEELAHQATHDVLTGLPNRALLLGELGRAVDDSAADGAVAVLFIDLDRFKSVNDELGHDVGDELLREVAERLSSVLRPSDVVARLGGDEFVVLCPDVAGLDQAAEVAGRLLAAVSLRPILVRGNWLHVTASVGITVSSGGPDHHPEGLLREADAAMYRAKALGRDRFEVFDAALRSVDTDGRLTRSSTTAQLARDQIGLSPDQPPPGDTCSAVNS